MRANAMDAKDHANWKRCNSNRTPSCEALVAPQSKQQINLLYLFSTKKLTVQSYNFPLVYRNLNL